MEEEIWKDIPGYEGIYEVSNQGRVRSLDRIDFGGRRLKGRMLSICTVRGYQKVGLNYARKNKQCSVHRLVAMAFIPNPNNHPVINHKDENPSNNNVNNLEWCTIKYNNAYGTRMERFSVSQSRALKGRTNMAYCSKPVHQLSLSGEKLNTFPSLSEAARHLNARESHISQACNGKRPNAYGYNWKFAE